ncbi:permease-like cell division protein FtsX [Peptoniphilus stercorisuis]|uniref:Cell division protein FtsX n=1 Tax=Peptoniphilus stercorisuis TaxID=1436965 RepID=A0ABS4KFQ5_9FIRM|nr:permease-like cell division protein FtsX [Peptoniphilus stercorisuis]MBP2025966.1 cell division transport system permease protein [Peptoniphilus stercorisuis]
MKKIRQSLNLLKETFKNLWRNKAMGFASIISIAAMLSLFGFVLLLVININTSVYQLGNELDKVVIYLKDETKPQNVNNLIADISKDDRVKDVKYTSKDDALNEFKENFGDKAYILDVIEENTLPASLTISLKDLSYTKDFADGYKDKDEIERVDYHYDLISKMIIFEKGIKYVGFAIVIILLFVSILIINNTIKITVANRRREINIMKYIGATNAYIRGPFLLEGIVFGIIGAIIATFVVYYGYSFVFEKANEQFQNIFGMNITSPDVIKTNISIIFACIGIGIGYLGSLVSTKRFLDV